MNSGVRCWRKPTPSKWGSGEPGDSTVSLEGPPKLKVSGPSLSQHLDPHVLYPSVTQRNRNLG